MKKNVDVTVTGIHSRIGEPTEKIENNSTGFFEEKEDGSSVLEYDEEQDLSGASVKVHNKVTIAVDESGMELERSGAMSSKLAFGRNLAYDTDYNTPYGTMKMKVVTKSFDLTRVRAEEKMKIMAEYALEIGGEVISDSMFVIDIKNAETN